MRPIRVLVIGNVARAGAELYAIRLVAALDRDRFEPILGTTSPIAERGLMPSGVRVVEFATAPSTFRTAWSNRSMLRNMASFMLRERVDVCNTMNLGINSIYAHTAARLTGVVTVETIQHTFLLRSRTDDCLSRYAASRAVRDALVDRYIALCNYLAFDLTERWRVPQEKIVINNLGVDTDAFRPMGHAVRSEVAAEFEIPADAVVVGYVGNPNPARRVGMLLEWLAAVRRVVPQAILLAVGVSDDDLGLGDLAVRLGVRDATVFCGHRVDVPRLLAAVDVFVQTARGPLLGNAQLEAMAAGVAVAALVSDADEAAMARETTEEGRNGFLIDTHDLVGEAGRLAPVLKDRRRLAEMGRASRRIAETKFSQTSHVAAMQNLYEGLALR